MTAAETTEKPQASDPGGAAAPPPKPRLPTQAEAPPDAARRVVREVRLFHVSGGSSTLAAPDEDCLPALMHQFRDPGHVRSEYPFVLLPPGEARAAVRLGEWLGEVLESSEVELKNARLLKDNAAGLELAVRELTDGTSAPADVTTILRDAGEALISLLSLRAGDAENLRADVRALGASLPEGALCVGLSDRTPVRLTIHAARWTSESRRQEFAERIDKVCRELRRIIEEDEQKRGVGDAGQLAGSLNEGAAGIDPAALAKLVGHRRGPTVMDGSRVSRIRGSVETLEGFLDRSQHDPHLVLHAGELDGMSDVPADVELLRVEFPCAEAAGRFDELADRFAPVALAARVAMLELADEFDPAVCEPMVESFGRQSLSADELRLISAVIAVEPVERLAGADMPNFTRTLLSGRPIRVMVEVEPGASLVEDAERDVPEGFRFEPGFFGLGHRQARVQQTAVSRPGHLLESLIDDLGSTRASLHVIATGLCAGGDPSPVGAWLHVGAALEGRAHALFRYDPEAGRSWADRLDFTGNEQPERDWPCHEMACFDGGGSPHEIELSFTFADFALLEPAMREHFRVIPNECPTNDLTPLEHYPFDEAEPGERLIPFVWGVDGQGRMSRLVISKRLLEACADRLSHWRTLQELAGIHNRYVERAVERERSELSAETAERIAALEAKHAEEIEAVRREAAGEAMGKLAEMLLRADLSEMAPARRLAPVAPPSEAAPGAPPTEEAAEAAPAAPVAEEEDEDVGFDDPYIDSPLCTSCNDCLAINPQMFVYNENKQATIGDADAGTYLQLVTAAEKCPARCIHPGKPRNPDEPNLDELTKRAKPFN